MYNQSPSEDLMCLEQKATLVCWNLVYVYRGVWVMVSKGPLIYSLEQTNKILEKK